MNPLCLDANIFIAGMTPDEEGHPSSFALLEKIRTDQTSLYEPSAVLDEVVGVLHRKARKREISMNEGQWLVELLFRLPLLLQWQEDLMREAMQVALSLSFSRVNDCLYLVVARQNKTPLITLDREFQKKGRKYYREILTPEEFLGTANSPAIS